MEQFTNEMIQKAVEVLESGGVILYPTDTVWGIGCDATNEAAVAKVYAIKQREDSKALVILMSDERMLLQYTSSLDLSVTDYLETVTKPTTVIYEGAIGLATNAVAFDGSVAVRIPKDDRFCLHLLKRFKKPIVSTSANISGQTTAATYAAVDDSIKEKMDFIIPYRQDDEVAATPSAIVKWTNGILTIIRD